MNLGTALSRYFPVPKMLIPNAAGIDITDSSIKWVSLTEDARGIRIGSFGQQDLPEGIVVRGAVRDTTRLGEVLKDFRKKTGIAHAHAALPEEGAYVFDTHVPRGSMHTETMHMVEFELEGRVPIPVSQAVYDFETIGMTTEGDIEIGVAAFSKELAEGYIAAFNVAGVTLLSLEIEARSIGRAVSSNGDDPIVLLADIGRARAGFAILKHGVPIFTSTVEAGGGEMTRIVKEGLGLGDTETEIFKNEQGLLALDPKVAGVRTKLEHVADALTQEVARHYRFWDTRRNEHGERVTPVGRIYLVGGSANLRGLAEYVASKVHAPTERPNVWRHVAQFDDYIPPIDRRTSLQYATAVGLALRSL